MKYLLLSFFLFATGLDAKIGTTDPFLKKPLYVEKSGDDVRIEDSARLELNREKIFQEAKLILARAEECKGLELKPLSVGVWTSDVPRINVLRIKFLVEGTERKVETHWKSGTETARHQRVVTLEYDILNSDQSKSHSIRIEEEFIPESEFIHETKG